MTRILRPIALAMIRLYQWTLSPLFYLIGVRCRHEPTCSHYAAEAFRTYRVPKALGLTLGRLGRCHPWGTHGYDPVPKPAKAAPETPPRP